MTTHRVLSESTYLIARKPVTYTSWWTDAARTAFTARCRAEYVSHMQGSLGERMVGGMVHENTERFATKTMRNQSPYGTTTKS